MHPHDSRRRSLADPPAPHSSAPAVSAPAVSAPAAVTSISSRGLRALPARGANAHSAAPLEAYAIGEAIGEGGHATVYAAIEKGSGRQAALKIPKGDASEATERIKREFRAARQLRHSGIVAMDQLVRVEDRYAILMERLEGPAVCESLRRDVPRGALPDMPRLTRIIADLAESLAHMHACGWIHGDIKPENVMFSAQGHPRWIDLGLATYRHRPLWIPPSKNLVGTFAYLPPESIIGEPLDPAADMFSFGRLLSMLLCGRLPSWDPGLGTEAADERIRSQLPPDTPPVFAELCTRLVRIAPDQRPTAADVYGMLTDAPIADQTPPCSCSPSDLDRWLGQIDSSTHEIFRRAAAHRGSILLCSADPMRRLELENALSAARDPNPRLVLAGCCDPGEETPLPAFDGLLHSLAIWIGQLPAAFRDRWRPACPDALATVCPELAAAFEIPSSTSRPTCAQLQQATEAIAKLMVQIAQQRTVVLVLHDIDRMDPASASLLRRLEQATTRCALVIAGTTRHDHWPTPSPEADAVLRATRAAADYQILG